MPYPRRRVLQAGFAAAIASAPLHAHSGPAADVQTLTRQADAWDKAILRKDQAAIEANGEASLANMVPYVTSKLGRFYSPVIPRSCSASRGASTSQRSCRHGRSCCSH